MDQHCQRGEQPARILPALAGWLYLVNGENDEDYSTSPPRRLKLDTASYRLNVAIVLRSDVLLTSFNYLGSSAPYDYLTESAYTPRPYVHVLEYL